MGDIFLKILNMSIAANWMILAVVLLRFVLKKAPKWIAVLLWGIVALRLVIPFSFESALSLVPSAETFSAHNIQYETPAIKSGIPAINNAVNPILGEAFAPNPAASVNPLYVWMFIVSVIWLIGIIAMLLYAAISYVRVRQSVAERVPYEENIFLCDYVKSPFILGLARPKIYLPSNIDGMAMEMVIVHEKAHLARRDHWWKPLGFLILAIHWFNPLCWIAYMLLCRDIELACDEKVVRQMDLDGKKQYSTALLECSTGRRLVTICPLAFGEIGVKERVKNVLNYKRPPFWAIVVSVIACVAVSVCFATDPKQAPSEISTSQSTFEAEGLEIHDGYSDVDDEGSNNGDPLDNAISQAILNHYASDKPDGLIHVESHVLLANEGTNKTPVSVSDHAASEETVYLLVLHQTYSSYGSALEEKGGSYIPAAITFNVSESGEYTAKEYWEPRDGAYYADDIRDKFPGASADDALNNQAYAKDLEAKCYGQALNYLSSAGSLDAKIAALLDTICTSPTADSAPGAYINAHKAEYDELLGYGEYTLRYCFTRFEEGRGTGLDGHIMMQACEDIAAGWGEESSVSSQSTNGVPTGQMWYGTFKNSALNLMEQYAKAELEKYYPASYLLLSMLGEV